MRMGRVTLLLLAIASGAILVAAPEHGGAGEAAANEGEVRALWVTRTTLTSPASIETMVASAVRAGFNTLLVQVRGRGDAYFAGGREPRAESLARQPAGFDPLRTVLDCAHDAGLKVHAWVNVGLVASAAQLPKSRDHVVNRHPEWLMVPRALAREMAVLDPRTTLYRDKLARWTREQSQQVEGLYLSPVPAGASDYTVEVIGEMAERYPIDGVHLDYVRYPDEGFDYSRAALNEFRADVVRDLEPAERDALDKRSARIPLAYVDAFPARWRAFRVSRLTALVERVSREVRRRRPGVTVTAAVVPDTTEALERRLQDWPAWLSNDLLDAACPMAYATDARLFEAQIRSARQAAGSRPVWAGIGAYRIPSSQTVANIQAARRLGATGIILFSYDSIAAAASGGGSGDYLAAVGRAAFNTGDR